jgi:uncharacterized protein (TIGR03435 family)
MKRTLTMFLAAAVWAGLAGAQAPAPQPGPETADVHVTAQGGKQDVAILPRAGVELRGQTLVTMIGIGYGVDQSKIVGGPPWLATERYDLFVRTPDAATFEEQQKVLQAILEARFHLVTHKDQRPFPVYILTAPKKPSLKESKAEGVGDCKLTVENGLRTYTCTHISIGDFAERIRTVAAAYFNAPVVDRTGLKGFYDFSVAWTGRANLNPTADDAARGVSAFEAVEKNMGLKVDKGSDPLPVLVVDSVDRTPTPNAPGAAVPNKKVLAEPTEFDAAEIHASRPASEQQESKMQNGRLELFALSLKNLLNIAYDYDEQMIVGGDKWVDSDNFDLVAKSAPTASLDALRGMLKKYLEESFKLKLREETQPVNVYTLTIGKGAKLKPTDGSGRGCAPGGHDGMQGFVCKNATVTDVLNQIKQRGRGYIQLPVVDLTGLTGAYDVELYWTPVNRLYPGGKGVNEANRAADPAGVSIFEAVDRQLGLKLAQTKRPMPALVIEHAEKPSN